MGDPVCRILCLGDVVGRPGVQGITRHLPQWRARLGADLVVVNAENACDGSGLTVGIMQKLQRAGCDVLTNGDHCWRRSEVVRCLEQPGVIRPANYMSDSPGRGWCVVSCGQQRVAVINVMGQVFVRGCDNPFAAVDRCLAEIQADGGADVVLVDVHAETTSEKAALGHHLDGRVAAVFGTHTHVATADEGLLPEGTGFITDLGMCGPHRSVIGRKIGAVVQAMRSGEYHPFQVATKDVRLNGAVFTIAREDGRCLGVERVRLDDPGGPKPT